MKTKDFTKYLNETLYTETKKIIKEQLENNDLLSKVKSFQTLSNLIDKIDVIKGQNNGFIISINDVSEQDIVSCCGGNSIDDAQKNLLQGLHYDMEEAGIGNNMDLDLSADGENGIYNIQIKVSTNDEGQFGEEYEIEEEDDKTVEDEEDNLILGNKTINENMKNKRVLRLTESQFVKLMKKIVTEAEVNQPYTKSVGKGSKESVDQNVPGVSNTKSAHTENGKQNKEHLSNVDKKMKDYLSFDGNDNPEFPKQIGKGEKVARQNTEKQEQEIEDNRGRGPQDLTYDNEDNFAEKQTERIKKALNGDSTMGNDEEEGSNTIKSDTGKKIEDNIKKRQEIKKEEPLYNRAAVPTEKKKLNEDILKMKKLIGYNQKTQ